MGRFILVVFFVSLRESNDCVSYGNETVNGEDDAAEGVSDVHLAEETGCVDGVFDLVHFCDVFVKPNAMCIHEEMQSYEYCKTNNGFWLNKVFHIATFLDFVGLGVDQDQVEKKQKRHHEGVDEVI